jgi:ABC-type glycerol-3-phosphate transport system substrate-binding protein
MLFRRLILSMIVILALTLSACGGAPAATQALATNPPAANPPAANPPAETAAPAANSGAQTTITVWDYYTDPNASPIPPLIEPFQKEYPNIKVKYEIMDWDTANEKLNVVLSGGQPPDVTTVDMTWLPKLASLGALTDLKSYSNGKLNGTPLEQAYTPGALEAMTYNGQIVTMMYDFDVYALYYRSDLFEQKGLQVPTTWDELKTAAQKLAEGDKYLYEYDPDTFHGSQFIYENGGKLMSDDLKTVTFNSPEAVDAIQFYADMLLKDKTAINWTKDQGERIQGVKDGRIAMFSDGPYYMGLLKSGAPEMSGKWKVALHPKGKFQSSYLGGTGLVIPAKAANKDAAWKFIEFAMRPENQVGVYKYAGAAPATIAAAESPEVNVADPYFGGQKTLQIFLDSMKTAHPFPYVRQWSDIDTFFTAAMQSIGGGQQTVKQALDDAASKSTDALSQ